MDVVHFRLACLLLHSLATAYQAPKLLHQYPFVWSVAALQCADPLNRLYENVTVEGLAAEAPAAQLSLLQ
jgi:hypothetical protein